MKQGINLDYLQKRRNETALRPLEDCIKLGMGAGFKDYDFLSTVGVEDYEARAKQARETFDKLGAVVHQTHCPFFRYSDDGPMQFSVVAQQAVKVASILGAQFLVIHADEWPARGVAYNCHAAFQKNYDLVAPVVEACLENGVRPAFENLFDDPCRPDDHGRTRYCTKAEELLTLIEKFHDPRIGICLDTGHAGCGHKEHILGFIRAIAPYVVCTHIHDNKMHDDLHQPAFLGYLPLEEIMDILKDAGYKGILSWEMAYGRIPDVIYPDFLALLHKSGEYLTQNF